MYFSVKLTFFYNIFYVISKQNVKQKIVYLMQSVNIPQLLQKVYGEVGSDRFISSWKEFNNRNNDQQDDFLMSDLSDEELTQLGSDFERLGHILSTDPELVELYGDFENNLNTDAFNEMDQRLSHNHTWWGRIKKFLYRKLEKLADEVYRKEKLANL